MNIEAYSTLTQLTHMLEINTSVKQTSRNLHRKSQFCQENDAVSSQIGNIELKSYTQFNKITTHNTINLQFIGSSSKDINGQQLSVNQGEFLTFLSENNLVVP